MHCRRLLKHTKIFILLGEAVEAWSRGAGEILFPEKVQSKWQLSNGHARSCAPKLQGSGKDEKLGPMSQAPEILVYVFAVSSGIPAAKLSVLVRLIKRERFRPVHFEEFRRNLERFMREKYCFG